MKKYAVLLNYDNNTKTFSLRCRSDIDTHPYFKRNEYGQVVMTVDGVETVFGVLYEGPEKKARDYKTVLEMSYNALNVAKA
jgi:hypothetical protein